MHKKSTGNLIQNKYKNIIIERLSNVNNKNNSNNNSKIHNLKTQCTPNDKTQNMHESLLKDF
jgi:hypothetical protein